MVTWAFLPCAMRRFLQARLYMSTPDTLTCTKSDCSLQGEPVSQKVAVALGGKCPTCGEPLAPIGLTG